MAEWKKEIRELAKGFCISKETIKLVIKSVERTCIKKRMPSYYKGNRNEFLYDNARREIMTKVLA